VKYRRGILRAEKTAMKGNDASRVLVGDSALLTRRRARALESFTTVRFPADYGTLWYLMSRRFC